MKRTTQEWHNYLYSRLGELVGLACSQQQAQSVSNIAIYEEYRVKVKEKIDEIIEAVDLNTADEIISFMNNIPATTERRENE